jgi:uncharacterized membrane protein
MKWKIKREILPSAVIVAFLILSLSFYSTLPDTIPTHFNFNGNADRISSKSSFIISNLVAAITIYALLTFIPFIDPFWKKIQNRYNIFLIFRDLAMLFLLFMFLIEFLSARAGHIYKGAMGVGFGLLFIFLGNYMPRLPRNFFFGIRTPWTLASEIVWKKTHIVGGWLFALGGIITVVLSFLRIHFGWALAITLIPIILYTGIIYPLTLYRKIQKSESVKTPEL